MPSVEQVRGQIGLARDQAQRGAQALQEAAEEISQAMQAFQEAAQGSNQSEANDVINMFGHALEKVKEAQQAALSAAEQAESYSGRL